jgi:thiol-disulfide isomerase/thioredoxin
MRKLSVFLLAGLLLGPVATLRAGGEEKKQDENKPVLKKQDTLTEDDAKDTKKTDCFAKVYKVKLKAGELYRIDMISKETDPQKFDPFLRLEDSSGKQLAMDDDGGGFPNAKIIFKAEKAGTYKVIATTFAPNMTGAYAITVARATPRDEAEARAREKALAGQQKIIQFRQSSPEEQKQIIDDLVKDLNGRADRLTVNDFQTAMQYATTLDMGSDKKLAAAAYTNLGKALAKADDEKVVKMAKMFEGGARRLSLPGNVMKLSGKTLEGKAVDLKDYKGKVVLVDFWATWCGPCIAELPNVKKLYATYHEKGFDVLAVSIDQNKAALEKFLEKEQLPWVCVHELPTGDKTMANHYGVFFIPCAILVDREGRVVSLNARGPELERLLKKYVGDKSE